MVQLAESIGTAGMPYSKVDRPQFIKEKTAAMILYNIDFIGTLIQEEINGNKMNWDMATYPSFPEAPGKSARSVSHVLMIAKSGKHKDEAFQVLSLVTSDKEVQSTSSRKGRVSALNDPEIRKLFGADLSNFQGKNAQDIFKATPAPNPAPTLYGNIAENPLNEAANNVLTGKMDINTALRQAEEKHNQLIDSMKQSGISLETH
jgi:multiple sugar transport system substrate-binding protein